MTNSREEEAKEKYIKRIREYQAQFELPNTFNQQKIRDVNEKFIQRYNVDKTVRRLIGFCTDCGSGLVEGDTYHNYWEGDTLCNHCYNIRVVPMMQMIQSAKFIPFVKKFNDGVIPEDLKKFVKTGEKPRRTLVEFGKET